MVSVGFRIDPVGEKNVKSLPETSICLYPEPVTTLLWLAELIEHFSLAGMFTLDVFESTQTNKGPNAPCYVGLPLSLGSVCPYS